MSAEQDVEAIRRLYDAINRNDHATTAQLLAPDMVRHDLTGMVAERNSGEEVAGFIEMLHKALPDLHMQAEEVFGNEDGRVAASSVLSGTHKGEFMGIAATGKKVSFAAITLYRMEEGRVAEAWSLVDWAGALRQMQGP